VKNPTIVPQTGIVSVKKGVANLSDGSFLNMISYKPGKHLQAV
jgi:hypothetical protein